MGWIKGTFFQSSKDERLTRVEGEVASVKEDVTRLKREMDALNAFRKLAEEAEK